MPSFLCAVMAMLLCALGAGEWCGFGCDAGVQAGEPAERAFVAEVLERVECPEAYVADVGELLQEAFEVGGFSPAAFTRPDLTWWPHRYRVDADLTPSDEDVRIVVEAIDASCGDPRGVGVTSWWIFVSMERNHLSAGWLTPAELAEIRAAR